MIKLNHFIQITELTGGETVTWINNYHVSSLWSSFKILPFFHTETGNVVFCVFFSYCALKVTLKPSWDSSLSQKNLTGFRTVSFPLRKFTVNHLPCIRSLTDSSLQVFQWPFQSLKTTPSTSPEVFVVWNSSQHFPNSSW